VLLFAGRMPIDEQVALQVAEQLDRVLQLQATPHADAVEALGRNCHLPNSCQTPLHAVLHYEQIWLQQQQQQQGAGGAGRVDGQVVQQQRLQEQKQQIFIAAVRDALAAGGCCASRASFVGACMGGLLGADAMPAGWLQKYEAGELVLSWADAVCSSRKT
jgi:hypothetical protein